MSSKAMSLKGKIKNYAKENNITAQVVLQNFMFECFLARLADSKYKDKFVIKGGMLVSTIVGLDTRSTMDLDTTLKNLALTKEKILNALEEIFLIDKNDNVCFSLKSIEPIRKDDIYGGFCARIDAIYDSIITPLSIDISTGDIITPNAVEYEFEGIFDESVKFNLWGYNIETILAEKLETILRRGVFTTRPRDYYDVFILATTKKYDKQILQEALNATAKHRNSLEQIANTSEILRQISESKELKLQWEKYQKQFFYAKNILFEQIINVIKEMFC